MTTRCECGKTQSTLRFLRAEAIAFANNEAASGDTLDDEAWQLARNLLHLDLPSSSYSLWTEANIVDCVRGRAIAAHAHSNATAHVKTHLIAGCVNLGRIVMTVGLVLLTMAVLPDTFNNPVCECLNGTSAPATMAPSNNATTAVGYAVAVDLALRVTASMLSSQIHSLGDCLWPSGCWSEHRAQFAAFGAYLVALVATIAAGLRFAWRVPIAPALIGSSCYLGLRIEQNFKRQRINRTEDVAFFKEMRVTTLVCGYSCRLGLWVMMLRFGGEMVAMSTVAGLLWNATEDERIRGLAVAGATVAIVFKSLMVRQAWTWVVLGPDAAAKRLGLCVPGLRNGVGRDAKPDPCDASPTSWLAGLDDWTALEDRVVRRRSLAGECAPRRETAAKSAV
jgi:hypothetical protein